MVFVSIFRLLVVAGCWMAADPMRLRATAPIVSVCEVLDDPASYDAKVVLIRGSLFGMYENTMSLSSAECVAQNRGDGARPKAIALRVDESLPFEDKGLLRSLLLDRAARRDERAVTVLTGRVTVFGLKEKNGPYLRRPQVKVLMEVTAASGIRQDTAAIVLSPCDLSIRGSQYLGKRLSVKGRLQYLIRYEKVGLVADTCRLPGLAATLSYVLPLVLNSEFEGLLGEVRDKEANFPKARLLDDLEVIAEGELQAESIAKPAPGGALRLPVQLVDVSIRLR